MRRSYIWLALGLLSGLLAFRQSSMRCATSAGHSSGTFTLRRLPRAGVISVTSSHRMIPTE